MSLKTENVNSKFDRLLWVAVVLLFCVGLTVNYYYVETALAIRIAGWLVLAFVLGLVALQTQKGKQFFHFTKDVRGELRKVVWPTRQETIQMTVIVIIMVIITGLILWGIDSLLMSVVNWLIG